jgi:DNA-binding transcriptional MerR regulator
MSDLTATEMALRLGVTRAAVHYYVSLGRLKTHRTISGDHRDYTAGSRSFRGGVANLRAFFSP